MPRLTSNANPQDPSFQDNQAFYLEALQQLNQKRQQALQGGGEASAQRHQSRGKLLVRDRINALLDPGSPFLEVGQLAGDGVYDESLACAGIVAGIGQIQGRWCMIAGNDATVKGGSYYPLTVKKHLRAQTIAEQNQLPCLYLVDSGGANLPRQDEVFPDQHHFGRIFFNQARMSAAGIAQIAVVMGSCTAGGAYVPAMCDETIIVQDTGSIFLAGPPLVKAATGEDVTANELGGAQMHCQQSGVADHLARDDHHALEIAREVVNHLKPPRPLDFTPQASQPPRFDAKELYGLIPKDPKQPLDIREVIARLVDGSQFHEFKPLYGTSIVCGFAHLFGLPLGIIANNGILFSDSATKAAHFIELCAQRRTPILFIQNIVGFMVGKEYEQEGIAKHGAKMVTAVASAAVPKITLVVGGSFGAGNYAMCGRSYDPHFMFSWPTSRIAVMGGEQAADVMAQIHEAKLQKQGQAWSGTEAEQFKQPILDQYEEKSSAYYASARLWDDGVIDPAESRQVLGLALNCCYQSPIPASSFGVFRM